MSRIAFRNFSGGEVTPTLCARYDLKKFGSFLQTCRNFVPNLHGDVERRPGTKYLSTLPSQCIIIPFQFNTDPQNNYALLFCRDEKKIYVANQDGLIADAVMDSPYNSHLAIYQLSFAQVADVLYLAHPNYALRKITRSGSEPYTWTIQKVALNASLPAPGKPTVIWHRGSGAGSTDNETAQLRYVVTSVDADGVESIASKIGSCKGRFPTDWIQGDYVEIQYPLVEGATQYNIYRESAGYYGYIGTSSSTKTTDATISGIKVDNVAYTKRGNYRIETYSSYDSDSDTYSTYYKLASGGSSPVYQGAAEYYAYNSSTGAWWCVGKASLSDTFLVADVTIWGGSQNDGRAPSGTSGGVTIAPTYTGGNTVGVFRDENYEPDTAQTPKKNWDPFKNGNNPCSVAFHQQRMWLGGGKKSPASIYASRTGDYESFRKSMPLQDDDALEYTLASGSVDDVKWIVSFDNLLIGTAGAEFKCAASKSSAITPSDCQITVQSYWGSKDLQPLVIGQSIMHCQRSGNHVRDLYYTLESDGYTGNDLSILAPQLVEGHDIVQWCYQQTPNSTVWAVRDDGILLSLTYMKEQNVFGWSRHKTNGKVKSIAVLNGAEEDVVMMVVERLCNGENKCYLERMVPRFKNETAIEDAWYVDSGIVVTPEEDVDGRQVVCSGLDHLAGRTVQVLADGSPEEHMVSADGTISLDHPASKAIVGFGYISAMCPLPMETDMQNTGTTLGKRRAYGKCVLRMYRSVGGSYAASRLDGMWDADEWQNVQFYELPFLPENWGEPCQPYSGDLEISLPSGQDPTTSI